MKTLAWMIVFGGLAMLVVLGLAAPAMAQTGEEVVRDTIAELTVEAELGEALGALIDLAHSVTFLPFAATFVVLATALIKRFVPVKSELIAFAVQVAVWVAYILWRRAGLDPAAFEQGVGAVTTILSGVAGLVFSSYASTQLYRSAASKNVPVVGYQRIPF